VANPRHLEAELERLAKINRQLARCVKGSKNRGKILKRRQVLLGRITRTRDLHLHRLTTTLAGSFETVVLEDVNVVGMVTKSKHTATHVGRVRSSTPGSTSCVASSPTRPQTAVTVWSWLASSTPLRKDAPTVARRKPSSPSVIVFSNAVPAAHVSTETSTPLATSIAKVYA